MKVRSAVAVLALLALAAPAAAQTAPTANAVAREGFAIGFGLGFGASYPCDECPSGALDFFVGAMANPNVAIFVDFGVIGNGDDAFSSSGRDIGAMTIGVRVWPAERLWLQGGVGIGEGLDDEFDTEKTSWAGLAGVGYDFVRKGRFSLDLRVRGLFIEGHQGVSFGVGLNWY
jgi:hypothetical protein